MLFRSVAAVLAAAASIQATSPAEVSSAPKQEGGFEVTIVYVTPEGGCPEVPTTCDNVPDNTIPHPTYHAETVVESSSKATETSTQTSKSSHTKASGSATYDGPVATLKPAVHWSVNTKEVKNIVPVPAEKGNKLYYGVKGKSPYSNPSQSGNYAYLTYHFNQPSVNLDQCGAVKDVVYTDAGLSVTFESEEAYEIAQEAWSDDDGMILITYTEGCGDFDKEDRCYFKVSEFSYDDKTHSVLAIGSPGHPDDLVSYGESEWGWWTPDTEDKAKGAASPAAASGASFSWDPSTPTPTPSSQPQRKTRSGCVAPADGKNGLPTACLGKLFDLELDDQVDLNPLSEEQKAFIERISRGADDEGIVRRWGWFKDAFRKVKNGIKNAFNKVVDGVKDIVNQIKFEGDFDHNLSYKVPDPESNNPLASTLLGGLTQAPSPWGPAILLKSFGLPEGVELPAGVDGRLDIFCVNCGVSGTARIAGRATWKPTQGITEGQIELFNDVQLMLQIGVDARVAYKQAFEAELFGVGLPGLSFGVVTIGPFISIGSKVALEAAASGRLLAGAELSLQNSHVLLDLVNPENTKAENWTPVIKPIVEVEGEVQLSASLGLPVGIKCGVKIATFDLSVGIVDEPSIKGTAQVAASIGVVNGDIGQWEGGFKETDGCTGILSQLSWRNQLMATVTGFSPFILHDTGENVLARGCLALPPVQPLGRRLLGGGNKYRNAAARVTRSAKVQDMLVDLTGKAKMNGTTSRRVTYSVKPLPATTFKDVDGYDYSTVTDPSGSSVLAACSNGNLYSFAKDFRAPSCSAMWASVDRTVVSDASKRVMHYYADSMSALGVSRLRLRDQASGMPESGVLVAWAPYSEEDDGSDYLYVAVDEKQDVFYPMVCEYESGLGDGGSRLFLAADPEEGAETLKRAELQHTVTGGTVKECYPLSMRKGASKEGYAKYV